MMKSAKQNCLLPMICYNGLSHEGELKGAQLGNREGEALGLRLGLWLVIFDKPAEGGSNDMGRGRCMNALTLINSLAI